MRKVFASFVIALVAGSVLAETDYAITPRVKALEDGALMALNKTDNYAVQVGTCTNGAEAVFNAKFSAAPAVFIVGTVAASNNAVATSVTVSNFVPSGVVGEGFVKYFAIGLK